MRSNSERIAFENIREGCTPASIGAVASPKPALATVQAPSEVLSSPAWAVFSGVDGNDQGDVGTEGSAFKQEEEEQCEKGQRENEGVVTGEQQQQRQKQQQQPKHEQEQEEENGKEQGDQPTQAVSSQEESMP